MDYIEFSKYFRYLSKCLALDHFVIEGKPFQRIIRISFKKSILQLSVYFILLLFHFTLFYYLPPMLFKTKTGVLMDQIVQVNQNEHLNKNK